MRALMDPDGFRYSSFSQIPSTSSSGVEPITSRIVAPDRSVDAIRFSSGRSTRYGVPTTITLKLSSFNGHEMWSLRRKLRPLLESSNIQNPKTGFPGLSAPLTSLAPARQWGRSLEADRYRILDLAPKAA